MKSLILFSLVASISAQAHDLSLEQLETNAKQTSEYKALSKSDNDLKLYLNVLVLLLNDCSNHDFVFSRDCVAKELMMSKIDELSKKRDSLNNEYKLTPEHQALQKALNTK